MRSPWTGALQVGGMVGIIACHVGLFSSFVGHLAVEVFFVLAGANMVKAVERSDHTLDYVISRAKRLAPEISVIWCFCLILVITGSTRPELILFLCSAPVFLENFIPPFFDYTAGIDWSFLLALWFVGALLQLQLLVFVFRRSLLRYGAAAVLGSALVLETIWRTTFAAVHGPFPSHPNYTFTNTLFQMPLTHMGSVVCGFLLGRGLLKRLGSYQPVILLLTLCAGGVNLALGNGRIPLNTFGYPDGLAFNYQYLWGYPLLMVAAASLCAPNGLLAQKFNQLASGGSIERWIHHLSPLTYGVYIFHGLILVALEFFVMDRRVPLYSTTSFLVTTLLSFYLAMLFRRMKELLMSHLAPGKRILLYPGRD